jgi:hypothetical protein
MSSSSSPCELDCLSPHPASLFDCFLALENHHRVIFEANTTIDRRVSVSPTPSLFRSNQPDPHPLLYSPQLWNPTPATGVRRSTTAIEEPPPCRHRPPPHRCRIVLVSLRLIRVARRPLLDLLVLALLTPPPGHLQRDLVTHATTPTEAMVTTWLRVSHAVNRASLAVLLGGRDNRSSSTEAVGQKPATIHWFSFFEINYPINILEICASF